MAQELGEFNALGMTTIIVYYGAEHGQAYEAFPNAKPGEPRGQFVPDIEKGRRMWLGTVQLSWDPKLSTSGFKLPSFVQLRMRGEDLDTNPFETLGLVPGTPIKFGEFILHINIRDRKQSVYFTYKEIAPA